MSPDIFRRAAGMIALPMSVLANNGDRVTPRRMLAVTVCAALLGCGAAEPPPGDASQAGASNGDATAEPVAQTLRVAVVYDDERVGVHFEFPTEQPSWYHQYWVRERGEWVRRGSGADGPDPDGFYEDRISMLLDDGSVEGFERFGGWMTAHDGMRSLPDAVPPEDVTAHPVLGEGMGRRDVRKYLPQTREVADPATPSWDALVDDARLEALRDAGAFLDLWQWRAHRSHPMGYADNGYVLHYRLASAGRGPFTDNVNPETGGPARMFDAAVVGGHALSVERLRAREYGQDDVYFISENNSVPYDPDVVWKEGDAIPHRLLREPDGSRGAIRATGRWHDGAWRVALTRSLAAPDPRDSKALEHGRHYTVAFAVHTGATGARWHLVTLPQVLVFGDDSDADLRARRVDDVDAPGELDWTALDLVFPGAVTWQWLHDAHPGSDLIRAGQLGMRDVHDAATLPALIDDAGHAGDAGSPESVLAGDPVRQVDALEALSGKHPGFRRGQAKGVCAAGYFEGTSEGAALSKASAFAGDRHPVIARFSVGGGNPNASDQSRSARGLALHIRLPDGEHWQMANISAPLYFIARPEHFTPFVEVRTPDPETGKPDPERLAEFSEAHPETLKQAEWLAEQPIGGSYAGYRYWGVNAFELTAPDGQSRFVRWDFKPQDPVPPPDEDTLATLGDDFLADELATRLEEEGAVRFDFYVQLAADDDSLVDATTIWPEEGRERVLAGTLVIESTSPGVGGECDRMVFNPLVLPDGIAPSDDPVLHARPAAYAVSFGRRAADD